MKKIKMSLIALGILCTVSTFAQEETKTAPTLSIGVEGALPVGDFKSAYNVGIGGSAKAAIPVFTDGFVTISAGYLSFSGKDLGLGYKLPAFSLIPLKAGIQYRFPGGLYLEPQLGYSIGKVKGGESDGAFTYAANVGFLVSMLDLSARYEASSKNGGTTGFIGLRVAYSFKL